MKNAFHRGGSINTRKWLTKISSLGVFPFLFALYPILALYDHNVNQVPLGDIVRSLFTCLIVTGLLMVFWRTLLRKTNRAVLRTGIITTLWLLLFFSFGHIYSYFYTQINILLPANILAALWAAIIVMGTWWIARKAHLASSHVTFLLNTVSFSLLLITSVTIPYNLLRNARLASEPKSIIVQQPDLLVLGAPANPPDIYYIVLDGYGRSDMLRQIFGIDNTLFLDDLRSRGFYIAEESHSNYPQTALSLASSLNFHYIHDLFTPTQNSDSRDPMQNLVQNSAVRRLLQQQGYRTVAFSTWYPVTEIQDADVFYPTLERLNPFESMLLTQSMAIFWVDRMTFDDRRMNYLHIFDMLRASPSLEGPKFVFAHLTVPHPPFVFTRTGEASQIGGTGDGNAFTGGREKYLLGYREQLIFTNQVVTEIVDDILANSTNPPVIIIQGDHGPGSTLNWTSMEESCLPERMAILNAYYLPGVDEGQLYPGISPVNTFRVVLNLYFGANLPLEPDRQFFSLWDTPYDITEVTGKLNETCPAWEGEVIR